MHNFIIFLPKTHWRKGIHYTPLFIGPKLIRGKVPIQYATFFYPKLMGGKKFIILLYSLAQNSLEVRNSAQSFSKLHYFFTQNTFSVLFCSTQCEPRTVQISITIAILVLNDCKNMVFMLCQDFDGSDIQYFSNFPILVCHIASHNVRDNA